MQSKVPCWVARDKRCDRGNGWLADGLLQWLIAVVATVVHAMVQKAVLPRDLCRDSTKDDTWHQSLTNAIIDCMNRTAGIYRPTQQAASRSEIMKQITITGIFTYPTGLWRNTTRLPSTAFCCGEWLADAFS
jgi:hypothetical protein